MSKGLLTNRHVRRAFHPILIEAGLLSGLVALLWFNRPAIKPAHVLPADKKDASSPRSGQQPSQYSIRPLQLAGISYSAQASDGSTTLLDIRSAFSDPPIEHWSTSLFIHLLLLNGPEATLASSTSVETKESDRKLILDVLLDNSLARRHLGSPIFFRGDNGVRVIDSKLTARGRPSEAHRDQLLATFGAVGLPLSQKLKMGDAPITLASVLQDSIANFDLTQKELEWTTLAYLHYLPPQRDWTNRFGERFSFDALARELLHRPLTGASCNGLHILISLAAMMQVDDQLTILSEDAREAIRKRLLVSLEIVIKMQETDGSWAARCLYAIPGARPIYSKQVELDIADTTSLRQAITSHLIMWLYALPSGFNVPDERVQEAANWLSDRLAEMKSEDLWRQYCPVSHSLAATDAARRRRVYVGVD